MWVSPKGSNALSAAIGPAQHDFRRRYAAAIEADDKVTLATLDLSARTSDGERKKRLMTRECHAGICGSPG